MILKSNRGRCYQHPLRLDPQEQVTTVLRLPLNIISSQPIIQCCVVDCKGISIILGGSRDRISAPVPIAGMGAYFLPGKR